MQPGRRAWGLAARRRRRRRTALAATIAAIGVGATALVLDLGAPDRRPDDVVAPTRSTATRVEVAGITATVPHGDRPTAPTPTDPPAPRRITIVATGDILLHMPVTAAAERLAAATGRGPRDFTPMFDRIRPLLAGADLALCHLETPLSVDGGSLHGNPVFNSAPEIATAIAAAGFDGCSTASNHSYDQGATGVRATLDHLDAAGVGHAGSARDAAEAARTTRYDVGGVTVAHLAYTTYLNGAHPAEPWMIDLATPDRVDAVAADAAAARAAGADVVIVSIHGGNEFVRAPSGLQEQLADAITAIDDVDLVIGHHAHVVQPIERRNGKWVAFGLGNLLSNQHLTRCCPIESQDGVVVRFTVELAPAGARVVGVDVTPTWVDRGHEYTIVPANVDDPTLDEGTRAELAASRERTAEAVRSGGEAIAETPPEVVLGRMSVSRPSAGG